MIIRKADRANQMVSVLLAVAVMVLISALLPFFYEPSDINGSIQRNAAAGEECRGHASVSVREKISDGQEMHAMLVRNNFNSGQEYCVGACKNMHRRNPVLKFSVLAGLIQTVLVRLLRFHRAFEDKHPVDTIQRRILGYIHSIDGKKELLPDF